MATGPIRNFEDALKRIAQLEQELEKTSSCRDPLIYKAIIDQSPVGISVRDMNGNLILCNSKWIEIWEQSEEDAAESLKKRKEELQLDEKDAYLGANLNSVVEVYKKGGDLVLDDVFLEKQKKWITQRFYSVLNQSGDVESVVVLTEDVTEQKRTLALEKQLEETTRRFHTLVNNLPVAAYTTDSTGNLISANPAMRKMFQANSDEDIYSTPVRKWYKDAADREKFLNELKNSGKVDNYEMELVREDGSPFWASVSANVTLSYGNSEILAMRKRNIS